MTRRTIVFASMLVLAAGGAGAQARQPVQPVPPIQPRPPSLGFSPQANICSTDSGWCNLPGLQPQITECACLTAIGQQVPGFARFFPTSGPPSPYLRPHTTPAQ